MNWEVRIPPHRESSSLGKQLSIVRIRLALRVIQIEGYHFHMIEAKKIRQISRI